MSRVNLGEISLLVEEGKSVRPVVTEELANSILQLHEAALKTECHLDTGNVVLTITLTPKAIDRLGDFGTMRYNSEEASGALTPSLVGGIPAPVPLAMEAQNGSPQRLTLLKFLKGTDDPHEHNSER